MDRQRGTASRRPLRCRRWACPPKGWPSRWTASTTIPTPRPGGCGPTVDPRGHGPGSGGRYPRPLLGHRLDRWSREAPLLGEHNQPSAGWPVGAVRGRVGRPLRTRASSDGNGGETGWPIGGRARRTGWASGWWSWPGRRRPTPGCCLAGHGGRGDRGGAALRATSLPGVRALPRRRARPGAQPVVVALQRLQARRHPRPRRRSRRPRDRFRALAGHRRCGAGVGAPRSPGRPGDRPRRPAGRGPGADLGVAHPVRPQRPPGPQTRAWI